MANTVDLPAHCAQYLAAQKNPADTTGRLAPNATKAKNCTDFCTQIVAGQQPDSFEFSLSNVPMECPVSGLKEGSWFKRLFQ